MAKFTFINHASYIVETDQSLLLVDPWVEGFAFDKGWSLLDESIKNIDLVNYISEIKKNRFIWLSHEHSDHFSVPFLLTLKRNVENVTFIFQKTLDGRVADFIRKLGFKVIESNDSQEFLDSELSIVTFPFNGGDSYCLTKWNEYSILNINDCVINDELAAASVVYNYKKYTEKIDLLLTQFGYANWEGNKNENNMRISSAQEKLERIKLQVQEFNPISVIPFASFVYFSHSENFHTNDSQNTPKDVNELFTRYNLNSKLIVLKPWDELNLSQNLYKQNKLLKDSNIQHWSQLLAKIEPKTTNDKHYTIDEIFIEYKKYKKKVFKSFLIAPLLLEKLNFIKPIKFYLFDLKASVSFSYAFGFQSEKYDKLACDISLSSSTLIFILKNEYGVNTTLVNGKFERISNNGVYKMARHFSPQEYMKMGYGLNHPVTTFRIVLGRLIHKMKYKKWNINPSLED